MNYVVQQCHLSEHNLSHQIVSSVNFHITFVFLPPPNLARGYPQGNNN